MSSTRLTKSIKFGKHLCLCLSALLWSVGLRKKTDKEKQSYMKGGISMTDLQIRYWQLQEDKRANRAKETETWRSNREKERISWEDTQSAKALRSAQAAKTREEMINAIAEYPLIKQKLATEQEKTRLTRNQATGQERDNVGKIADVISKFIGVATSPLKIFSYFKK